MKFDEVVAQLAHIGWGAFLMLELKRVLPIAEAGLIVAGFAFAKELIECTLGLWEPRDTVKGSTVDFIFWLVGIMVGIP